MSSVTTETITELHEWLGTQGIPVETGKLAEVLENEQSRCYTLLKEGTAESSRGK